MVSPVTNQLSNEVVNFIMTGARCDVVYKKGSLATSYFDVEGVALLGVTIRLFYQQNGTLIKEWIVDLSTASPVGGTFPFEIQPGDLPADLKPLDYFWEAYDETNEFLCYGTFTLV